MQIEPMEPRHREAVTNILREVGIFNDEEFMVALEVVDSYLNGGKDYLVRVAVDDKDSVEGYICYGRTPLTDGIYHLYWIAVRPSCQRKGVGRKLMKTMESEVSSMRGRMILLETSSTERYRVARDFYLMSGYKPIVRIEDFYRVGDALIVYKKELERK